MSQIGRKNPNIIGDIQAMCAPDTKEILTHPKVYFIFEKETVDDEERGRDGIGGVEVEKLSI